MAAAIEHLGATQGHVQADNVERLSPLRHDHIDLHATTTSPPPTPSPEVSSAASDQPVLRPVLCSDPPRSPVIDAGQPKEKVLRDIKRHVWSRL